MGHHKRVKCELAFLRIRIDIYYIVITSQILVVIGLTYDHN